MIFDLICHLGHRFKYFFANCMWWV